jgi:hypothetical protein
MATITAGVNLLNTKLHDYQTENAKELANQVCVLFQYFSTFLLNLLKHPMLGFFLSEIFFFFFVFSFCIFLCTACSHCNTGASQGRRTICAEYELHSHLTRHCEIARAAGFDHARQQERPGQAKCGPATNLSHSATTQSGICFKSNLCICYLYISLSLSLLNVFHFIIVHSLCFNPFHIFFMVFVYSFGFKWCFDVETGPASQRQIACRHVRAQVAFGCDASSDRRRMHQCCADATTITDTSSASTKILYL